MSAPFLPPSFTLDRVHPVGRIRCYDVTLATAPCPTCGHHGRIHSKGRVPGTWVVRDLPHGAPVELHVTRRRYECAVCKMLSPTGRTPSFGWRGPDVHPRFDMTDRLHAHVLSLLPCEPLSHIEARTGVPASTLWKMAIQLSQLLEQHHRFPTPKTLAMDGIKILGSEYMVIGDGLTGLPVGMVPSIRSVDVRAWSKIHLDEAQVRVVVADLHKTNTSIAGLRYPHARYVADKWHVIQRFQAVLSQVINKEIDRLRKSGQSAAAKTIYDFKPGLMAMKSTLRRTRRTQKGGQRALSFHNDLQPILASNPEIDRAFWARRAFIRFYSAPDLATANVWLKAFWHRARHFAHLQSFQDFAKLLHNHRQLIDNYFSTVTRRPDGKWRGVTTNALEQHNGQIRKRLRARNGVQNFALLRLISVYANWRIGEDILLCPGPADGTTRPDCERVIGPVYGPSPSFEMRKSTGIFWRCAACR